MKRLFSVLVMLLFIFSIVGSVYAKSEGEVTNNSRSDDSNRNVESDDSGQDSVSDMNEDESSDNDSEDDSGSDDSSDNSVSSDDSSGGKSRERTRIQERAEMLKQLREDRKERFEAAKEALKERREIAKQEREQFRQDLEERKTAYEAAKREYKSKKGELLQMQQRIRECKNSETDECKLIKEQSLEDARALLLSSIEGSIAKVKEIKTNVQANEYLSEEAVAAAVQNLDDVLAKLDVIKTKVQDAQDGAALRDAAKEYNQLLKNVDNQIKIAYYRHAKASVHAILVRAEILEGRLQTFTDMLAEKGLDTSSVQGKIDDFAALIVSAKENAENADAKFVEADTLRMTYVTDGLTDEEREEVKALVEEGKTYLDSAKQDIKDAYELLKDILKELRELNKGPVVLPADPASTEVAVTA